MYRGGMEYWEMGLEHLKQYYAVNGNSQVPQKYDCEDGFSLGSWVAAQRVKKKNGRLAEEQEQELNKLQFTWDWRDDKWEEGYKHLKEYSERYGTAQVSKNYACEDGFLLGVWMRRQRHRKNKAVGNQKPLTDTQIQRLNEIGMVWLNPDKGGRRRK